ncbi:hypothetical protein STEG23_014649, partial [Scotinomys teguina]
VIRTHMMKCVDLDEVFCEEEDNCGFKATMKREAQSDYLTGFERKWTGIFCRCFMAAR